MDDQQRIKEIIIKAVSDEGLTIDEKRMLDDWLVDPSNRDMFNNLQTEEYRLEKLKVFHEIDGEEGKKLFAQAIAGRGRVVPLRIWYRYVAAAVILLGVFSAYWLFSSKSQPSPPAQNETMAKITNDVAPGKSKATLTLADGRKIVLDNVADGKLARQGGTAVENRNGRIVYNKEGNASHEMLFNTLSTNKGEMYATTLSDGTKIWLNASSSIHYPVEFNDKERSVAITGEAYFEVTHDAAKPFIVHVNDMRVQVLGTHFNINSYSDESLVKTTLLEGLVKVTSNGNSRFLHPGQQAQVGNDKEITMARDVNLEEVMAWKDGRFYFEHADVTEVLRQLARWYNIDVVYEGEKPTLTFSGKMQRNFNLSMTLQVLEKLGLRFRVEGHKLIITK